MGPATKARISVYFLTYSILGPLLPLLTFGESTGYLTHFGNTSIPVKFIDPYFLHVLPSILLSMASCMSWQGSRSGRREFI